MSGLEMLLPALIAGGGAIADAVGGGLGSLGGMLGAGASAESAIPAMSDIGLSGGLAGLSNADLLAPVAGLSYGGGGLGSILGSLGSSLGSPTGRDVFKGLLGGVGQQLLKPQEQQPPMQMQSRQQMPAAPMQTMQPMQASAPTPPTPISLAGMGAPGMGIGGGMGQMPLPQAGGMQQQPGIQQMMQNQQHKQNINPNDMISLLVQLMMQGKRA